MPKKIIFSEAYSEIHVDSESGIIHAIWKGFLNYNEMKKACEVMTDHIIKHELKFHLSDHRLLKVLSKDVRNYLEREWFPIVEREGLSKIGAVLAEDVFAKANVEKVNTVKFGKMTINTFDSPSECESWFGI
jgi:hypothetical protein